MNMKLLCLGVQDVIPPDDGGKEGIHGALAALGKKAKVTYAYPAGTENPAAVRGYARINVHAIPVGFFPRESLGVIAGSTLRLLPYKFGKHATSRAVASFAHALKAVQFDAIVCFQPHTVRLAEGILKRRGARVPIILRANNIEYQVLDSYARHLRMPLRLAATAYAWITRRHEQHIWRRVEAVALVSDADMSSALDTGVRANFVLAREGVPLPTIRNVSWPGRTAQLLVLLNPNPRVPQNALNLRLFFDRYWAKVQAAGLLPGIPLAVTGVDKARLASLLRIEMAELDAQNVRALGYVQSLPTTFASSLALVSATFVGAGIRKKILEAMAHQLPVIATPLDIRTCSFYENNVNVLCMDSVEHFVTAVKRLADDPRFWTRLSQAGRSTVERHADWQEFAEVMTAEAVRLVRAPRSHAIGGPQPEATIGR
jgi:glycosyltransferase involved in cell wall biosynthesis